MSSRDYTSVYSRLNNFKRSSKMAFGFMKSPYEKLRDAYFSLSEEDRAKFKSELMDIDKAEDEREIDEIEKGKADNSEVTETKAEEVIDESEEIAKDIDKAEDIVNDDANTSESGEVENTAKAVSDEPAELVSVPENADSNFNEQLSGESTTVPLENTQQTPEQLNEAPSVDYKAMQDTLDGLNAKYEALESKFAELLERYGNNDVSIEESADVGVSGYGKNGVNVPEVDDRLERVKKALGYKNY